MAAETRARRPSTHRLDIELAWKRAELSGLSPGMNVREAPLGDFDKRSRLLTAASPVLDQMADDLATTAFSLLLADRTCRIVDRRVSSRISQRVVDGVSAVPGFQYLEELSGTNSLATAFELRQPIAVTGDEHFLEALRRFSCYGAPIVHPITNRLEGVLDVSGPVADSTALLGPFLMRAVRDVEQRLVDGARMSERRLWAEFQAQSTRRTAVVALGDDLVLANAAAAELVASADHVALRAIAAELAGNAPHECALTLTSGARVSVRVGRIAGKRSDALFHLRLSPLGESGPLTVREPRTPSVSRIALVTGEPGTGRTTVARDLAGPDALIFDAVDAVCDATSWLESLCIAIRSDLAVVIDNIDLLTDRGARMLASPVRVSRGNVVLTAPPPGQLNGPHAALASLALIRHDLQPLRTYPDRFAVMVKSILAELLPSSTIQIAPSALEMLMAQQWPGNMRELRAVCEYAARARQCGVIVVADLPESIRTNTVRMRTLTPIESAERGAIVAALRASNGNRAAAAAQLGIGRTTLYDRLKRYRISEHTHGESVRNRNISSPS